MPARAPKAKKAQIAAMGARVEVIEGTRQTVSEAALAASEDIFYASHNWQPYFIEGTKTLAFEIWEQSGFSVPDNIVVPLGYGSNVIGLYLGFQELTASGEIDRMPRIFGAQAANCAALFAAWEAGGVDTSFDAGETIADGIASEKPVRVSDVMVAVENLVGHRSGLRDRDRCGIQRVCWPRFLLSRPRQPPARCSIKSFARAEFRSPRQRFSC